MEDKKLFWLVSSNADLSVTCSNLPQCMDLIQIDFENLSEDDQLIEVYTIVPQFMTDEEYANLPEAEF